MNRRIAQLVSLVVAVSMVFAAIVMAGKPPKPGDDPSSGIVATTTDQYFLDNEVNQTSSRTLFDLDIEVSGKGTHYRYKVGPAATTDPSQLESEQFRDEWYDVRVDLLSEPDGPYVLYLQGVEYDRKGNIKNIQPLDQVTTYTWTKDTTTIPALTWLEPNGVDDKINPGESFTLKWDDTDSDDNAVIDIYFGEALPGNHIGQVFEDPDGQGDELQWNTTGLLPGTYFVGACITDGKRTTNVWSEHPVVIGSPPDSPWTWQSDELVPVGTWRGSNYQVEMDGAGNAMAVGTYQDDRGTVLNYSVYNGTNWSAGVDIIASTASLLTPPILKARGTNQYLLVYFEESVNSNGPPADVKAIFFDGTTWDATPTLIDETYDVGVEIADITGTFEFNYGAACGADGTAMVVWREAGGAVCTRLFNGEEWEMALPHNLGMQPAIAADDCGNYMIAYAHGDTNGPDEGMLYYMHFDGFTWTDEQRLNEHDNMIGNVVWYLGEDGPVRLAGAGNNLFVAAYTSQVDNVELGEWPTDPDAPNGELRNIHGRFFNGLEWEEEALLDNQVGQINGRSLNGVVRLAFSPNGTALVTWMQIDNDRPDLVGTTNDLVVYGSSFDGQGNWAEAPTKLSYNTYGAAKSVYSGLVVDALGNGIATFYDRPYPDTYSVVKVHFLADCGWQLQAVDDPQNRPTDREALTGPDGYSTKHRIAGQLDGKVILLFSPYTNQLPFDYFVSREFGD